MNFESADYLEVEDDRPVGLIIRKQGNEHVFKKPDSSVAPIQSKKTKTFRSRADETPTYTGGVSKLAEERLKDSKKKHSHRSRDDRKDHKSRRKERSRSPKSMEPRTPIMDASASPGKWDDDNGDYKKNRGHRSSSRHSLSTPRATPAYKYNTWMKNRKPTGATPSTSLRSNNVKDIKWFSEEERQLWEDEQKRLDREWYHNDQGFDENEGIFNLNDEYMRKKEEQMQQKTNKRISAQQRQYNRDNELWEKNRMLTSGVVFNTHHSDVFDDECIERVHILVHNIVPPFLNGRIVFTKQPEIVIPVRDPTSDMAIVAKKGILKLIFQNSIL